jgi:hypothetical protein
MGRLFSLGRFLKNAEGAQIFGYFLPTDKAVYCFSQKTEWDKIWAIFSLAHPVTLEHESKRKSVRFIEKRCYAMVGIINDR